MYYDEIPPTTDLTKIADAVKKSVQHLVAVKQMSFEDIATQCNKISRNEKCQTTGGGIKLFLRRSPSSKIKKNNHALPALYNLFVSGEKSLPDGVRVFALDLLSIATMQGMSDDHADDHRKSEALKIGGSINNWLNIDSTIGASLANKFHGRFYLFRKSSESSDTIIKSNLDIDFNHQSSVLCVRHIFINRYEQSVTTYGPMFHMAGNIYALLENSDENYVEFITLNYLKSVNNMANGILVTADMRNNPLTANIFIVPHSEEYYKIETRTYINPEKIIQDKTIQRIVDMIGSQPAERIKS